MVGTLIWLKSEEKIQLQSLQVGTMFDWLYLLDLLR